MIKNIEQYHLKRKFIGMILKYFILLISVIEIETFSEQNKAIIHALIRHYFIKDILILSNELIDLETYFESSLKGNVIFEIHTKDELNSYFKINTENNILLFIVTKDLWSLQTILNWRKRIFHIEYELIIAVVHTKVTSFETLHYNKYSQVLYITNEVPIKYIILSNSYQRIRIVQDFIETPGFYWPKLNFTYPYLSQTYFPQLIGKERPKTGLLFYFIDTFEKYYENFLYRIAAENYSKIQYTEMISINAGVSEIFLGHPLKFSKVCFMLPIVDEISQYEFLSKPFHKSVWISLFVFIVYLTISLRIILIPDLFLSFYESLACTIGLVQNGVKNKFLYCQIFIFGFIIWSLYNAKLSSYLTTPYLGKLIQSAEDVETANVTLWSHPIIDVDHMFDEYTQRFSPKIFEFIKNTLENGNLVPKVPIDNFYKRLHNFDISHGYLVDEIQWNFISRSQSLLRRKLFTFYDFCSRYLTLSPFKIYAQNQIFHEFLTLYTMKVVESGLDFAWEQRTFQDIKLKFIKDHQSSFRNLKLKYFISAWWIFGSGMVLSIFVFFIECWALRILKKYIKRLFF